MQKYDLIKDVKAILTLYKTENGGKRIPISTGYTSPIKIREDEMNDVRYYLIDKEEIKPGESGEVYLGFMCPELVRDYLEIGKSYKLWEGGFKGEITIIEILEIDQRIEHQRQNNDSK